MIVLLGVVRAAEPVPPVTEVTHPSYVDAVGTPLTWTDVRRLAVGTDERREVARRRVGRAVLRVGLAGATAAEVWGGVRLLRSDSWVGWPLLAQAAFTGTCAVLTWTRLPGDRLEDRAILLDGVNASLVR